MSTVAEKYRTLINRLYEKTVDKSIQWTTDPLGQGVIGSFGSYFIKLQFTRNSENTPLEVVEIQDSNGKRIDRFNDENLGDGGTPFPSVPMYYDLMREVRKMAQRQASGADDAIDDILKGLE